MADWGNSASDARTEGNVHFGDGLKRYKWTADDWTEVEAGRLPMRNAPDKWQYGDVDAALKEADLVIDETVVCQTSAELKRISASLR